MRRATLLRRSPLRRGSWRRKHPLEIRPGQAAGYGPGWRLLCRKIRERDGGRCRYCGEEAPQGAVDHLLPRRLFANRRDPDRDREDNLAWLCAAPCHALKTQVIEPALYQADYLTFHRFLLTVSRSGPIPSTKVIAAALGRLVEMRRAANA